MRVAILSSGGKDSAAAWWWATCQGWDVNYLVTVVINGEDSMMFQIPGVGVVEYQAKLAGIDWLPVETQGEQNKEMQDLEHALSNLAIDALVCGALRSDYQKSRIERMCHNLGIISYTPLWHQSGLGHITGLVENGFGVVITSVACEGLDASWIGKTLDNDSIKSLIELSKIHRFNVDGEGGEYETLVTYGPHFVGKITIDGEVKWFGQRGELEIKSFATSLDCRAG